MMKNKLLFSILLATIFVVAAPAVLADGEYGTYGAYGSYSGQPIPAQTISINKKVGKITGTTKGGISSVDYVDNLTASDARFKPGSQVMFQITVKNTSTIGLLSITVKDYVPSFLEPMEGPGNYDTGSRTVSWDAGAFQPGEVKTYYLKMQVFGQNQLPSDKGLFCLTNRATAFTGSVSDTDTAQFCVEKEVIGVTKAPAAGPEAGVLLLGLQSAAIGVGFSLKKLASKK